MSTYVKLYAADGTPSFRSIPAGSFRIGGGPTFLAGGIDKDPLFASFDGSGNPARLTRYALGDGATFHRSAQCDNGDFLLYGQFRRRHLLVRVNADGKVIWARTYFSDRTFTAVDFVKIGKEIYTFTSRGEAAVAPTIEVVTIDGDGNVKAAVQIEVTEDSPVTGLIPFKDGCIVYGHTGKETSSDVYVAVLDAGLGLQEAKTIGNADPQVAAGLLQFGDGRFVLAGESGKERDSFVTQFQLRNGTVPARVFDFKKDSETGHKLLRNGAGDAFYLVAEMPIAPRVSFVAKFTDKLQVQWMRRFSQKIDPVLFDLRFDSAQGKEELLVCGLDRSSAGFGARTDGDLNSCATLDLPVPRPVEHKFTVDDWPVKAHPLQIKTQPLEPRPLDVRADPRVICDSSPPPDTKTNPKVQSPYIYLQTAGSDGSDDSVSGFHLRWEFMRGLGEQHLPKGDLAAPGGPYPTNIAFNRPDDYVRIYKTSFAPEFGITIDVAQPPSFVVETGPIRAWVYADLPSSSGGQTDVIVRFTNPVLYTFVRQTVDPMAQPRAFLLQYSAPIELHTGGKLFFYLDVVPAAGGSGRMRLETISLPDSLDPSTRHISSRREIGPGGARELTGENWEYLRFDLSGLIPSRIHLITYEDYLTGIAARNGWQFVDRFALDDGKSDNNAGVFRRLEDPARFTVHQSWRKFNEPTSTEFRVNVANYQKRWTLPEDGLQAAVETYLTVSRVDPLANVTLPNQDPQPNDSTTEVSYLAMLQFTGLDYHVSRMLGRGTIDPVDHLPGTFKFVYLMQYYTQAQLELEPPALVSHLYIAPPIGLANHRLPPVPELLPVVYGLDADACGGSTPLTDTNGYVPYADVRFINLHRRRFQYEQPFEPFFAHTTPFDLFDTTQPVLFGVEYGAGPAGTGSFVRPEISNDPDWIDPGGLPEVRPVPDTGENPVYTHGETQPGIHHYAMYSINWFARASASSNQVQTNETVFDPRNTMAAPANFKVYLVQREPSLILSTQAEQDMLTSLAGPDRTLVRATFDWNQVQNAAYQFADRAQFFFRVAAPGVVKGQIVSVTPDALTKTALLTTGPYIQSSQPATMQPFVDPADVTRFAGAALVADGETFVVDTVVTGGNNPQIRVRAIRQTASADSLNENIFCTSETFINPAADVPFVMVENLDSPSAWDTQLTKDVAITQFTPVHTEVVLNDDGTSTTRVIGGLTGPAVIAHIFDPDPDIGAFIPSGGPAATEVPTGVYVVTYDAAVLAAHPDPDVTYYQGTIRLKTPGGSIRELVAWSIDTTGPTLRLVVFDPTFGLKREADGMFVLTGPSFTPADGADPIAMGPVAFANFHPGYRVYLVADVAAGHNFRELAILPALDEGTRNTFMTIRVVDSTVPNMASSMATPVVLLALEIREPVPPGVPLGALYATRPDFYGKATYTFDTQLNQPFSLIFYRANERRILDQLYDPATVRAIYAQLAALTPEDALYETNRWNDLVNLVTDGSGQFVQYVPDGFRFPPPTNPNYQVPDPLLSPPVRPFTLTNTVPPGSAAIVPGTGRSWAAIVKEAIDGAFVPLTDTPPVYRQLRDTAIQTSGRPPNMRDVNGNRLSPTDPQYDPWPMAVRFERNNLDQVLVRGNAGYGAAQNRRFVRFTDYTLDGAARNMYFYGSRELSNQLTMSAMSPIVGPVKLVNAAPAEAPGIGRVTVSIANSVTGERDGVRFELNGYLPSEGIRQIQLYRATSADDAISIRTMSLARTVDAGADLMDTFDDLPFIPYGDPLFYRIVAMREIRNERSQVEMVPSKPSNLVMASLVDNANPPAPRLSYSSDAPIGSPLTLHNVTLTWEPTCYNGTYYVYKRTKGGHWTNIAVQQGNPILFYQPLAASDLHSGSLAKEDEDGNRIYHQFRVVAMNTAGLLSLEERVLTI